MKRRVLSRKGFKVDEITISGFIDYNYIGRNSGEKKVKKEISNVGGRLPCPSP